MEDDVKKEFEKVWKKLEELECSSSHHKQKIPPKAESDGTALQKIIQTPIQLSKYPVDKCKETMDKCLLTLTFAKAIVNDYLLTSDIRTILETKLRPKNKPSLSMISNAMKKAEKLGYVTALPVAEGWRGQRKYIIEKSGEKYSSQRLKSK